MPGPLRLAAKRERPSTPLPPVVVKRERPSTPLPPVFVKRERCSEPEPVAPPTAAPAAPTPEPGNSAELLGAACDEDLLAEMFRACDEELLADKPSHVGCCPIAAAPTGISNNSGNSSLRAALKREAPDLPAPVPRRLLLGPKVLPTLTYPPLSPEPIPGNFPWSEELLRITEPLRRTSFSRGFTRRVKMASLFAGVLTEDLPIQVSVFARRQFDSGRSSRGLARSLRFPQYRKNRFRAHGGVKKIT